MNQQHLRTNLRALRQLREQRAETAAARRARTHEQVTRLEQQHRESAEAVKGAGVHRQQLSREFDERYRNSSTHIDELLAWRREEMALIGAVEKTQTHHASNGDALERARADLREARQHARQAWKQSTKVRWIEQAMLTEPTGEDYP